MPGSQKAEKSRRVEQCVYVENGRRCRRSATGDPPVCNAHKVVFVDAARAGARPSGARRVGDGIYNLLERMVAGERVTKRVAREAFEDARDLFDEYFKQNGFRVEDFAGRFQNGRGRAPDPEAARREIKRRAIAHARQVLGFAPGEPITADAIKKRHRELARKYHPDRGGSLEKMKEINAAVDILTAEGVT